MEPDDIDPRYSLANERTFLAWVRTALGLLAAAAGLLAVDLPWPADVVDVLSGVLAGLAGFCAVMAWHRWRSVEAALAAGQRPSNPKAHVVLAAGVGLIAVIVIAMILA